MHSTKVTLVFVNFLSVVLYMLFYTSMGFTLTFSSFGTEEKTVMTHYSQEMGVIMYLKLVSNKHILLNSHIFF